MILLSGELHYSLVSAFGVPSEEYGFKFGGYEALSHLKTIFKATDCPKKYDPYLYFLVASAQGLNPNKNELDEVSSSFLSKGVGKQQLKIRQQGFLEYQLQDISLEEEEVFPSVVPVVTTPQAATQATSQATKHASISFTLTTNDGRGAPIHNKNISRSYLYMFLFQGQQSSATVGPTFSTPLRQGPTFVNSQI